MNQLPTDIDLLIREGWENTLSRLEFYSIDDFQVIVQNIVKIFNQASNDARLDAEPILDKLAQLSIKMVSIFGTKNSAAILTNYAFYQEQIGNFHKGIDIGLTALAIAETDGELNLQRRAHSVLGNHYMRIRDFRKSCYHLEIALRLARKQNVPLFECAILTNISGLFYSMGLYRDSTKVALKAIAYPNNTVQLKTVQAVNAINILKASHLINDEVTRDYAYLLACKKMKYKHLETTNLITAYFEFGRALYLIDRGKKEAASRHIDIALLQHCTNHNPRVDALLQTAKALCAFASHRPEEIRKAKKNLKLLLFKTKEFPAHHEDVLRALVQIYAAEKTLRGKRVSLEYAQQLRQYALTENEVRFSLQLGERTSDENSSTKDQRRNALQVSLSAGRRRIKNEDRHHEINDIYEEFAKIRESVSEERFRTEAYAVAENWALAAEFSSDGSGRHCFRVGKLASAIAINIGWTAEECVQIEFACRLHDIGKIANGEVTFRRPEDYSPEDYQLTKEHAVAGAQLLNCSADPLLKLAASIARSHHEWWNGCGCPDALRGEEIPLEARICAIADAYDELTNAGPDHLAWSHQEAIRQVLAMSGVQLDPNLIDPFLNAVGKSAAAKDLVVDSIDHNMERNSLVRAKKKLFEALELVD